MGVFDHQRDSGEMKSEYGNPEYADKIAYLKTELERLKTKFKVKTEGSGRYHAYVEATAAHTERPKSKHRVVPLSGKIEQYEEYYYEPANTPYLFAALVLATAALAKQPNIIIVMTDDQSYPELSVNGNPILKTPPRSPA